MDLMLLLTLPGTALIQDWNQGQTRDQTGIRTTQGEKFPKVTQDPEQDQNQTQQDPRPSACPLLLSSLSSLRAKEHSLLFGDFSLVYNSSSVLVFLRSWDQSPQFLVLFNYSPDQVFSLSELLPLQGPEGGAMATRGKMILSSNSTDLSLNLDLDLSQVQVGPQQSVLLKVPQS